MIKQRKPVLLSRNKNDRGTSSRQPRVSNASYHSYSSSVIQDATVTRASLNKVGHLIPGALSPSIEEQAARFFSEDWANYSRTSLISDIRKGPRPESFLVDTVHALGLAGLAHYRRSPHLWLRAKTKYVSAIEARQYILGNSERAKENLTLYAVT
jgi:hypothetical protein